MTLTLKSGSVLIGGAAAAISKFYFGRATQTALIAGAVIGIVYYFVADALATSVLPNSKP